MGYALLTVLLTLGWNVSFAQSSGQRLFPETGHSVAGEFLAFYESVPNPEFIYGFPITDEFTTQPFGDGIDWRVQYFQRARFLLDPSKSPGQRVIRTPLGSLLHEPGISLPLATNPAACRFFAPPQADSAGHQVCYAFLAFYERHGGVEQFGYPISDFELEGDRIVQYFEYAKMTWHPEMPAGQRVRLADLGRIYFGKQRENLAELKPPREVSSAQTIQRLRVRAFPEKAVTSPTDQQTLFIIVQDQTLQPVPQAQVTLTFVLPSGAFESVIVDPTDENGIARYDFAFQGEQIGAVQLSVSATYGAFTAQTRTSFRIWW